MTLQDAFKLDHRTAAAAITGAGKPNFNPCRAWYSAGGIVQAGQSGFAAAAFPG